MKQLLTVFLGAFLVLSLPAHAEKKSAMMKGGLGFIYQDHNSFQNPAAFASSGGAGLAADFDKTGAVMAATPSFVYGRKGFGIGAYGQRAGTNLMTAGAYADAVGGALGFSMFKDKFSLGAGYNQTLGAGSIGVVTVSGLIGSRQGGFTLGFGGTMMLQAPQTKSANVALGYMWKSGFNFEADAYLNDFSNMRNMTFAGFLGGQGKVLIISLGGSYALLSSAINLQGRLGVQLGRVIDLMGNVSYGLGAGGGLGFGGTLRFNF